MTSDDELVPMPADFWQQVEYHRDRVRRLALESPCPVCEVPSGQRCTDKNPAILTAGMHWFRYPGESQTTDREPFQPVKAHAFSPWCCHLPVRNRVHQGHDVPTRN